MLCYTDEVIRSSDILYYRSDDVELTAETFTTELFYSSFVSVLRTAHLRQEAQLPQGNSASAAHVILGWLGHREIH